MEGKTITGWAARDKSGIFSPYSFALRKVGDEDVMVKVLYCGLDHTDVHQAKGEIHDGIYPMVPGHEVVGEVVEVGSGVGERFKVGAVVGVGCVVRSCGECDCCNSGREQYCSKVVITYNDIDIDIDGLPTRGGFASAMVVNHRFAVNIPKKLAPEQAAPLLCAGVTAYSPLKRFCTAFESAGAGGGVIKGGILGLGGVGHVGVLIAKAMGHQVTVITSSEKKKEEALQHLGADAYIVSRDEGQMAEAIGSLDYILDTIPAAHPLDTYLWLLKPDGRLILVGVPPQPLQISATSLILGRKTITGSFVGSMAETEEFLNFWADKNLSSMIEVVPMDYVNKAVERMERNDVRYRFVLNVGGN